jgi:hypothetical protein
MSTKVPLSDGDVAALAQLRIDYEAERILREQDVVERLAFAKFCGEGDVDADGDVRIAGISTCRYCGRHRQVWACSRVDGHALCIVGDAFKASLGEQMRTRPRLTYANVSSALGVTPSLIRAWFRWYMERVTLRRRFPDRHDARVTSTSAPEEIFSETTGATETTE